MITTILVDDEQRGLHSLKKMLEQHCPGIQVVAECRSADTAKEKIREYAPALIFLDITMPGKNAFDMLGEIGDINFEIIFVTAHNNYTMQALRYSAVDYLLKPVDEDLLIDAVKRTVKKIRANEKNKNVDALLYNMEKLHAPHEMKLCLPSIKGFQVINLSDIIYCQAESSYTIFHLINKLTIVSSKTISEYETMLANTTFCRIHKSFLVNLVHVKEYLRGEGGSVILTNNLQVEVSRRKKEIFLARMKELYKF